MNIGGEEKSGTVVKSKNGAGEIKFDGRENMEARNIRNVRAKEKSSKVGGWF